MSPLMGIRNVFEYILDEWGIDELQGARGNGRIWPDGEPPDVYLPVDDAAGHPEAEAAVDRCLVNAARASPSCRACCRWCCIMARSKPLRRWVGRTATTFTHMACTMPAPALRPIGAQVKPATG